MPGRNDQRALRKRSAKGVVLAFEGIAESDMVEDSGVAVDGNGVREGDVGVWIEVHRSHFADWSTGHDTKSANSCGGASAPTRPSGVGH